MSGPNRGDTGFGVVAAVAMIACCGLPLLLSAGVLAGAGALLRSALLVGLGLAALIGLVIWASRRARSDAACDTDTPVRGRTRSSPRRRGA